MLQTSFRFLRQINHIGSQILLLSEIGLSRSALLCRTVYGPNPLMELSGIIITGISAQWLAWRLKLPSILLLMVFGFVAGPLTGFLHPGQLLGPLLSPFISISLALILFEGGLSLKIADLTGTRIIVRNLLTIGVFTTWLLASSSAYIRLLANFRG